MLESVPLCPLFMDGSAQICRAPWGPPTPGTGDGREAHFMIPHHLTPHLPGTKIWKEVGLRPPGVM